MKLREFLNTMCPQHINYIRWN